MKYIFENILTILEDILLPNSKKNPYGSLAK